MRLKTILLISCGLSVLATNGIIVYFYRNPFTTSLQLQVQDNVSKSWVWDSSIQLQGRIIRSFFQSDQGPVKYQFTNLKPGEDILEITAPSYKPILIPVTLKRGINELQAPVNLKGFQIPDLKEFIIFNNYEGLNIVQQIRPVSTNGRAILNHPAIDISILARISVQIKDGIPTTKVTDSKSGRGEILFLDQIYWKWDSTPETNFRYSSKIPGDQIIKDDNPFRVIDFLIIVPDFRFFSKQDTSKLLENCKNAINLLICTNLLNSHPSFGEGFKYYSSTSWNVLRP